jgi:hypothetical protein
MRLFVWDRAARGQVWRMLGDALVAGGRVHSSAPAGASPTSSCC